MMAAYRAAVCGAEVTLFERNEKLGKKMYISGKGRCNLTNDCSVREFLDNVPTNAKFLTNALYKFAPQSTLDLCAEHGLAVKTERGNRVFPLSDKSSDVISFFARLLREEGVKITLNTQITSIVCQENGFLLNTISDIVYDKVIIATGGVSYPLTGSTGDGWKFAKNFGLETVAPKPALCRILCKNTASLEGLSLKNVEVSIVADSGKVLALEFGEMLFTDDGVSGPCSLTLSSKINKLPLKGCFVSIDLKPALDEQKLDERILRDFSERMNKDFVNALDALLPQRLCAEVVKQSEIAPYKKVNQITSAERAKLVRALKGLRFPLVGLDDVSRGIVTSGGVNVKEINPSTMECRRVSGLYFVGEALDVDAFTGGFNIQIALSTGYVAGENAAKLQ